MQQEIIGKRIDVLDKGFVELVDFMPHPATEISGDLAIVNAARRKRHIPKPCSPAHDKTSASFG